MKNPHETSSERTVPEKVLKVGDIRMLRPIVFHDKKSQRAVVIQPAEFFKVESCKLTFSTPNNVSIFVSISHRERMAARKIYDSLIAKPLSEKRRNLEIRGRNLKRLYNYLEHIQSSIIAIYTALESFANVAIPNAYKLEKKNQKGVTEIWTKEAIERWYKTSDKLADILPEVLKIDSPKKLKVWATFRELEDIRNDIIHQKTMLRKPQDVDSSFLGRLLQPTIFSIIGAGFSLIGYFCSKDTAHAFFPLGFGPALVKAEEVDDLETSLEVIEDDEV